MRLGRWRAGMLPGADWAMRGVRAGWCRGLSGLREWLGVGLLSIQRFSTLAIVMALLAGGLSLSAEKSERWLEVRSPQFVLMTKGSPKTGRLVALQFAFGQDPESPAWVPFVANQVEDDRGGLAEKRVKIHGISARDKNGSTCTIWLSSDRATALVANIYDRPHHVTYVVDFRKKMIMRQDEGLTDKLVPDDKPMTREDFNKRHSQDKFLGKKVVSGVECEGYKLHDPQREGKFLGEVWYAPGLNFEPVRSEHSFPDGQKTSTVIQDIQVGKEPDPQLFSIPEDFQFLQ